MAKKSSSKPPENPKPESPKPPHSKDVQKMSTAKQDALGEKSTKAVPNTTNELKPNKPWSKPKGR